MKIREVFLLGMVLVIVSASLGQLSTPAQDEAVFNDPESLLKGFFASVSWEPGSIPDWEYVRKFFIPQQETIEKSKFTVFGEMAQCFVVYKAKFKTPVDAPGQIGLDNYSLMKKDGRWWIVSISNEIPTPQRPLPEDLF